jgi:DNA mismatch repair protein MutS
MYDEYINAYKHHSSTYGADTAVFYQVGKFFEFYDWVATDGETQTSMRRFTDILGVRVTVRKGDGPKNTDGLFAGVPEQSLHKYAALLTRANWTVVVYEQVKDAKGAVKSRDVTRILTPGTHVEAAAATAVWIGGVWLETSAWGSQDPPIFATMALDLTTGKSLTYEGRASGKRTSWTSDNIFHFFQVYLPRECVVWWKGDAIDAPSVETLQRQFGLPGIRIQIFSGQQGGLENSTVREEFLLKTLAIRSLLPIRQALALERAPCTERLLCSLLSRVKEQYPSGLISIPAPSQWIPQDHLSLGNQALFQLNMVAPQMEDSVLGLFQKTYTVFGRRAMRNRILYPKANPAELLSCYEEIQSLIDMDPIFKERLHTNLKQIEDLPRLHRRLSEGEITPSEILLLDKSYICAERLVAILYQGKLAKSDTWQFETVTETMGAVFSVEKAATASDDAFCFVAGCAPEVDRIEEELAKLFKSLDDCLKKIQAWGNLAVDSIRLEFREVMGPTITGTKAAMAVLRSRENPPFHGIQFQQKKSSSQLEIPFLENTFQQILRKRVELQKAVRQTLPKLCSRIADACLETWNSVEDWIATIDVTNTLATVAVERGFVRPELLVAPAASVSATGLRHPLIEAMKTRVEYVKHNVSLGSGPANGWLVYGMNASGKSSLMKAVGIALILAQAGSYVPATSFQFSPFRTLFTRILNTDNLWAGLSSFAVEMTELREILQSAGPDSLVLGDEVCSGTESVSATAIVAASITHLHQRQAKFIFATHLHTLLDIPSLKELSQLSVWHLKVRYDPVADRLIYERTLEPGAGSSLYGLEVARAMNLPEEVLALAHEFRRGLLGTASEMDAPGSDWNTGIQRKECELCKCAIVRELEVHHIRPRREANVHGVFDDGAQQDHMRNLIVVCSSCHDRHHAGLLTIAPVVQTSDGPIRLESPVDSESVTESHRRSKWTDEQTQLIVDYLKRNKNVPPKRAVFDLGEMGIEISVASLRRFRA